MGASASASDGPGERACGSCGLCCKVLHIEPLKKPAHVWCRHYVAEKGCGIHGRHPRDCKIFRCRWLEDELLGEEWRPDRCGFVMHWAMGGLGLWINVDLDRPGTWRNEPYYSQIKQWAEMVRYGEGIVAVTEGNRRFVIFPEQDLSVSEGAPRAAITAGYRRRTGWRQPFAQIKGQDGSTEEFVGVPIPELL